MEGETFHLTADRAIAHCDENTIGVVAILGSTFDGSYEPVKEIAEALDQLEADKGCYVPLHVDAASGGFVAPFLVPELEWDFRLERVQSINASGHKYGLVYPGVGWAIWRDAEALPSGLVFNVNYLGGNMPTFALNFSRPGSEVIAQYFMFMSLGHAGYTAMMETLQHVAMYIADGVANMGPYRLISKGNELPVFAFTTNSDVKNYTVFDVSDRLRERGWLVPAYSFPENRQDMSVLRVVVRAGMHKEMAEELLEAVAEKTKALESLKAPLPPEVASTTSAFAH
jgi:glutamate decarboxylase